MLVLTDVTWSSDNTGGHISWSRLFQWSEMCWWWCLCLFSRVQSSQKHHLLTVIVSTPWRDIQSHHGSRTSSLMTATQNSWLMRQNTPCLVCTACFTFFFFFLFDACSHTLLSYMLWFGMCWLDSHLQLPVSLCLDSAGPSKRTSVSSFQSVVDSDSAASINLNMEQNNVNFHIKKQSKNPSVSSATEQKCKYSHSMFCIIYARLLC